MAFLGYSPLPPVLVQEDFLAVGRMNGAAQPPPPTAANCKNPYVDGTTLLPGAPVVAGIAGGGVTATPAAAARRWQWRRWERGACVDVDVGRRLRCLGIAGRLLLRLRNARD